MWDDLNMTQRNELIKLYLNNGISSLDKMKEHYNSYQDGGRVDNNTDKDPVLKDRKPKANFRTHHYKEFYPSFNYATGGSIEDDDPKSLLDKKKIYNRLPADASEYKQTIPLVSQTVDALKKYYRNPDNYVDNKINAAKKAMIEIEGKENLKDFEKEYLKFKQKHIIALEDAKDVYLGMPQRTGTITTATEEPTIRTSKNPLYKSSFMKEPYVIENYWIPAINNLKLHNIEGAGYNQDYPGDISEIGNSGKNAVSLLPLLGNATVGYGVDPKKGEYISYYDDWNINMSGTPNTKDTVGKYFGGKPFELYDRLYLDEYYKINTKPDKGVYYGGYLPEIIIFDND